MSQTFITNLRTRPEYFTSTLKLIESAFKYNDNNRFEIDFAPLVANDNWDNLHIIVDSNTNQVISHVGILLKTFKNKNYDSPIAFAGGIATNSQYRGQGHLKKLLLHVMETYQDKISLFMLWSDLDELYKKFNFHRAGTIFQAGDNKFENQIASNYIKTKFSKLNEKQWKQIKHLYEHQQQSNNLLMPKRNSYDWDKIKLISSCDLYLRYDQPEQIESYFCINKGQDLTDIIHEVASKTTSSAIYNELANYKVWLPSDNIAGLKVQSKNSLALMRIGNQNLFSSLVDHWTENQVKVTSLDESQVSFVFERDTYHMKLDEFLNALFGPVKAQEFDTFKINFYISGLDSI